jgi:hypothetical protein
MPKEQVIDPRSMVACNQIYNAFLKMKSITVVENVGQLLRLPLYWYR